MRYFLSWILWILAASAAYAQGGPGPLPSPWSLNGPTLYYNNGGITLGNPVGGSCGIGCINVSSGLRINGVPITPISGISPPTATALGGVYASSAPTNQFVKGISTSGLPLFAQPTFSNLSGQAILSQLPNMTAQSVLCNATGGSNSPTACTTLPTGLSIPSPTMTGTAVAAALTTSGLATLNSVSIPGGGSVGGTLTANNLTVFGTLTPGSFAPANISTGNGTFTGTVNTTNLTVTGTATFSGTFSPNVLTVSNNGTIGGTLGVTGATTLSNSLTVSNNATVGGILTATGALSKLGGIQCGTEAYAADFIGVYAYGNNAAITCQSDPGQSATFATRTLNATGGSPIGVIAWGFNDRTASAIPVWARYAEARKYNTVSGGTITNEQDITEFNSTTPVYDNYADAYSAGLAGAANLWLASGGGCTAAHPCYDAVAHTTTAIAKTAGLALGIISNGDGSGTGADYARLINFGYNAIHGVDGKTAGQYGPAISMAMGQTVQWEGCSNTSSYPSNCAVANIVGDITSQATNTTNHARLVFQNGALQTVNTAQVAELQVDTTATDTSGIEVSGSSSGIPSLHPVGAGGNLTLYLFAKGTGTVQAGSPIQLPIYTIATLLAITCNSSIKGATAYVSDTVGSAAPSFGGVVAGGGATIVNRSSQCNGTNWVY